MRPFQCTSRHKKESGLGSYEQKKFVRVREIEEEEEQYKKPNGTNKWKQQQQRKKTWSNQTTQSLMGQTRTHFFQKYITKEWFAHMIIESIV